MTYNKKLDALKGISCFMVMTCHFFSIYTYSDRITGFPAVADWIIRGKFPFYGLTNATFWLMIFLIISGYLLSFKKITGKSDFIRAVSFRFFRLFVPIFFCGIIIALLSDFFAYTHSALSQYISCEWLFASVNPEVTLWDVPMATVKTILLGTNELQSVFWMISPMFYSSVVIYLYNWIKEYIRKPYVNCIVYIVLLTVSTALFGFCGFCILIGSLLDKVGTKSDGWKRLCCALFSIVVWTGFLDAAYFVSMRFIPEGIILDCYSSLASFITAEELWGLAVFLTVLIVIKSDKCAYYLSGKGFDFLYSINWEIYCIHMLVINSLGIMCFIYLCEYFSWFHTMLITYGIVAAAAVLLSVLYRRTISRIVERCLKKIRKVIDGKC